MSPRGPGVWPRIGWFVVHRPWWAVAIGLALLLPPLLALPSMRLSFDTLAELPADAESVRGARALEEHIPPGQVSPVIVVVDDEGPVTDPAAFRALADLSRNLRRLPGVAAVRSVAMPTNGEVPDTAVVDGQGLEQLTSFADQLQQAADGAAQLAGGAARLHGGLAAIDARLPDLATGLDAAGTGVAQLLEGVGQLREGVGQLDDGLAELADGLTEGREGARRLRDEVAVPAEAAIREAWTTLAEDFTVGRLDPAYPDALRQVGEVHGRITGRDPTTGAQVEPAYDGLADALDRLGDGLADAVDGVAALRDGVSQLDAGLAQLADGLRELQDGLHEARPGVDRLIDGVAQLEDGAARLEDGAARLADGLATGVAQVEAADLSGLLPTGDPDEDGPFTLTAGMLDAVPGLRERLAFFLADDDTRTRLFVSLSRSPFSNEALATVETIREVADLSLASSPLENATVRVTGVSAFLDDLDRTADADFGLLVLAVVLGVFLVLVILLRALIAPLYMVATVLLSFGAALGATVAIFQGIVGDEALAWFVPPFLFVLLVALGADYTIYLMSRVREEAQGQDTRGAVEDGTRLTGGVITSAGLILAGTFAALAFAEMTSLRQLGVAVTIGILLDTFVVRTLLLPAIAGLVGPFSWWPSARWREG